MNTDPPDGSVEQLTAWKFRIRIRAGDECIVEMPGTLRHRDVHRQLRDQFGDRAAIHLLAVPTRSDPAGPGFHTNTPGRALARTREGVLGRYENAREVEFADAIKAPEQAGLSDALKGQQVDELSDATKASGTGRSRVSYDCGTPTAHRPSPADIETERQSCIHK